MRCLRASLRIVLPHWRVREVPNVEGLAGSSREFRVFPKVKGQVQRGSRWTVWSFKNFLFSVWNKDTGEVSGGRGGCCHFKLRGLLRKFCQMGNRTEEKIRCSDRCPWMDSNHSFVWVIWSRSAFYRSTRGPCSFISSCLSRTRWPGCQWGSACGCCSSPVWTKMVDWFLDRWAPKISRIRSMSKN